MTGILTCPSCQTRLRVPGGTEASSYTCPRCLGEIHIPVATDATGFATNPSPARPPRVDAPAPEEAPPERCEFCDEPLGSRNWRFCPSCAAPVRSRPRTPIRRDALDNDVARDRQGSGWFSITLLILGLMALLPAAFASMAAGFEGFSMFLLGMVILVGIVWAIVYSRTRQKPEQLTTGRVARGVLITFGGFVVGYFVLGLVVILMLVMMFFVTG